MSFIDTQQQPILILDIQRCKRNIKRMAGRAEKADTIFRPHFKTHQSKTVGRWFHEIGVTGITVSSVSMAQYFADDGWNDITIAFPFHYQLIPGLQKLENRSNLRLFINSKNDLDLLEHALANSFKFYIEIDPDYGRSGIKWNNTELIQNIITYSKKLNKPHFHGFYIHDGRTYQSNSEKEIRDAINPVLDILVDLKKQFPEAVISLGDTPSASKSDRLYLLDEMTPGNFVFYDYMQVQIGSCSLNDVAMFAVLPVGQTFPNADRTIVHGGAVHLSKEYLVNKGEKNFGQVINYSLENSISEHKELFLTSLSQEHGTLNGLPTNSDGFVWVCPIHSCLTANLYHYYHSPKGEIIEKRVLS